MCITVLCTIKEKASYEMGRGKPMSNQQLVNLRIDFAFKQLFGTSGNEDILIAFLNAMLRDSLKSPIVSTFASRT